MKYTKEQIENAKLMAELASTLVNVGITDIEGFIKDVNGIEDKGLKVVDLESGIYNLEISNGEFKAYDKDGNLTIHIPENGKKAVFYGTLELSETKVVNSNPHGESIKLLEELLVKEKNNIDVLNTTYGNLAPLTSLYKDSIAVIDKLEYSINKLKTP